MRAPRYELRCAEYCEDRKGAPRIGTQWVHVHGFTLWVCDSCAGKLGKEAGITTPAQRMAAERRKSAVRLPGFA